MWPRACATMEREGMRVVAHGKNWCRPQPVGKKSVRAAAVSEPSVFEKWFWLFAGGVIFLWACLRVFDFTLLPPMYNGLVITRPFCGLHSWDLADRAWAARSHLKYGLGYTKGLRTLVVGDPPPLIPEYYVSHPPPETWILALGMLIFGTQDWWQIPGTPYLIQARGLTPGGDFGRVRTWRDWRELWFRASPTT